MVPMYPSSFDPNDPALHALPHTAGWRWASCEEALREFETRGVLLRLPLFWQTLSPLNDVCRSIGAYIFPNEIENMAVGAVGLRSAGLNTVLTTAEDAEKFASFLQEQQPLPASWFIVHEAGAVSWELPAALKNSAARIAQEVHLSPGLPVLAQCTHLRAKKMPHFHTTEEAHSHPLPFQLAEQGLCVCGKKVVTKP